MKAVKETIRKYYKYQYKEFVQPVLTSNGTLGGDSFAVAGNTNTYIAFDGATSGASAYGATNNTVIVYNPNPICLTNVYLNAYSYLHNVYGLQEVLCADTLDGEREVVFSQSIGDYTAERNYSFPNNTRYAKYWFITYASVGGGGYAIHEYQLTGTVQTFIESTESDYDFYKDIDTYKLPKGIVRKYYKYQYSDWVQPVLTANGTLGGSSFAVRDNYNTTVAFQAFDNSLTTAWFSSAINGVDYLIFYNPIPLIVTNINCYNYQWITGKWEVYGSNDNEYYELLASGENKLNTNGSTFDINLSSNTKAFKYYKINCLTNLANSRVGFGELTITAQEQLAIKSTESDYDFYEDKITYYGIGE